MALNERNAGLLMELRDTAGKAKVGNRGRAVSTFLKEGLVEKKTVKGEVRYVITASGRAALKALKASTTKKAA